MYAKCRRVGIPCPERSIGRGIALYAVDAKRQVDPIKLNTMMPVSCVHLHRAARNVRIFEGGGSVQAPLLCITAAHPRQCNLVPVHSNWGPVGVELVLDDGDHRRARVARCLGWGVWGIVT